MCREFWIKALYSSQEDEIGVETFLGKSMSSWVPLPLVKVLFELHWVFFPVKLPKLDSSPEFSHSIPTSSCKVYGRPPGCPGWLGQLALSCSCQHPRNTALGHAWPFLGYGGGKKKKIPKLKNIIIIKYSLWLQTPGNRGSGWIWGYGLKTLKDSGLWFSFIN